MTCTPDIGVNRVLATCCMALALAGCGGAEERAGDIDAAMAALDRDDGFAAELHLRAALEDGADRGAVALPMAQAELAQGNLPEARSWLAEDAIPAGSTGAANLTLARVELAAGDLPAAASALDRAWQDIPDDAGLWATIAELRYRGGEHQQALEASERAVELDPDDADALHFRARLVRDAQGPAASIAWFDRAARADPHGLDVLSDYAVTLGEAGHPEAMLTLLRRVAERDPDYRRVPYAQAILAARAGRFELARSLLESSGMEDRGVPAAMLLSGIVDLQNDNPGSAAQTFATLANRQPENRRVALLLARALDRAGSHAELVDRFEEDALQDSAPPYLVTLVGRAHEALGDRERAATFLDRATRARSDSLVALQGDMALGVLRNRDELRPDETLALVRDLIVADERGEAVRQAHGFWRRHRGSADALALTGDALLANMKLAEALADYRASAAIRRPWPLTRKMAYALDALGRRAEAHALVARHLAGDPYNAEAANLLARAELEAGRYDRAALLADHAASLGGGRDPYLLTLRAQIALRRGDADAEQFALAATRVQPLNRAARDTLALIRRGERNLARR